MSLLHHRGLGPLLVAELVSSLGSQMTFLALPWFVLVTTGSAARMGLVLAVELLPVALLGIPSGELIGRIGARQTMLVGDLARGPLLASVPLLHAAGVLTFPVLLGVVFLVGCFWAPYFSAQRLILPELVGDDEATVAQANVFVEGAQRVTALVGPATAGVLIGLMGASNVLYLDAATFAFSALVLAGLVPRRAPVTPGEEGRGVLAGVRYVIRDPLLAPIVVVAPVLNMFGQMLVAALPVLAYEEHGGSSRVAGIFFAAFGLGAVAGSLLAIRIVGRFEPMRLASLALVGLTAPVFLLALNPPVWGVVLVIAVSAAFGPLVNAPLLGVVTTRTPEAVRAKVMTAVITMAMLAGPLGLLVVGPLLDAWGSLAVIFVVAVGQLATALGFAVFTLRRPATDAYRPPVAAG